MATRFGRRGPIDDHLVGTGENDELFGWAREDGLWSDSGSDTLEGFDGDDFLSGGSGDDFLFGGGHDDELDGGPGGDLIDGGTGFDTALFWNSRSGVVLNLDVGRGFAGDAAGDTFVSIEKVIGSFFDDFITGDDDGNVIYGFLGDDTIRGGIDSDELYGDEGIDHLYGNDGADHLYGGSQTDYLHGQDDDDTLDGGAGDDFLHGGLGADTFIGSAGADLNDAGSGLDRDLVDYSGSPAGVVVDLTTASGSEATARGIGGFAEGDRYRFIEDVTGSAFDDRITGDFRSNALLGGGGADDLRGAQGNDLLIGGAGADQLDGGDNSFGGADLVSYKGSSTGVWVDLAGGWGRGGDAEGDKLARIEDITGSSHKDTLFGDGGNNTLDGAFGSDELHGREGVDILMGGAHDDRLWGDAGADHLWGGSGSDTFMFAGVSDSPFSARGASATFDTIHDFVSGSDQIDLSAIDANTTATAAAAGNQTFSLVHTSTFTGAGQLRINTFSNGTSEVLGETTGDGVADLMIVVIGHVDAFAFDIIM